MPGTRISAPVTFSPPLDEGRAVCLAPWRPASVMATQSGWAQPSSSRVCEGGHRRSAIGPMAVGLVLCPVLVTTSACSLFESCPSSTHRTAGCRARRLQCSLDTGQGGSCTTSSAQGLAQGPTAPPSLTLAVWSATHVSLLGAKKSVQCEVGLPVKPPASPLPCR